MKSIELCGTRSRLFDDNQPRRGTVEVAGEEWGIGGLGGLAVRFLVGHLDNQMKSRSIVIVSNDDQAVKYVILRMGDYLSG